MQLNNIALISSGGTPSRKNQSYWNGDVPWVTTSEIDFNIILNAEQFITEEGVKNSSAKKFSRGTLLMAMYGQGKTRGKVAKLGICATTNQACAAININRDNCTDYYFYYLASQYEQIRNISNDGGQKNLSSSILKMILVLRPPLPEQKRIVAVLEAWDEYLKGLDRKIEVKKNVKKGLMQQLLTGKKRLKGFSGEWKSVRLCDVCKISKGTQLNREHMIPAAQYPVINGGVIPSGFTDSWNRKENKITISEGGNSCGYVNFIKQDFWCGGHCYVVEIKNINMAFLYQSLKFNERKIMSLRVGSGLPNIQKGTLDAFKILVSKSMQEQQAIANILTKSDDEVEVLEKKRVIIANQKKYFLNKLIIGEIRTPEDLLEKVKCNGSN